MIEWLITEAVILCGGIAFAVENGRWLEAAACMVALLAINSLNSQLMYWRAKQRMQEFASRQAAPIAKACGTTAADQTPPARSNATEKSREDSFNVGTAPRIEEESVLSGCPGV